jgi:hypothetical protein
MTRYIVNRHVYDTDKAELIVNYENGLSTSDFNHIDVTLYRTRRGHWFTIGGGGAMTEYARDDEDGSIRGSYNRCFELSDEDAKAFLFQHADTLVSKYFTLNIPEGMEEAEYLYRYKFG